MVPVTVVGRAVAFILMLGGIAFFSGVTANLASFLVKSHDTEKKAMSKMVKEVEGLRQDLAKLRMDSGNYKMTKSNEDTNIMEKYADRSSAVTYPKKGRIQYLV